MNSRGRGSPMFTARTNGVSIFGTTDVYELGFSYLSISIIKRNGPLCYKTLPNPLEPIDLSHFTSKHPVA